jgi:hypothetical protein
MRHCLASTIAGPGVTLPWTMDGRSATLCFPEAAPCLAPRTIYDATCWGRALNGCAGALWAVQGASLTVCLFAVQAVVFWGGKALFAGYFLVLPLVRGVHSLRALLALWALAEGTTGWVLAGMFQVGPCQRAV